jgi:hypothetical protein
MNGGKQKSEIRRQKQEARSKKQEGRSKKQEARRKKEEGRRKKTEGRQYAVGSKQSQCIPHLQNSEVRSRESEGGRKVRNKRDAGGGG